MVEHSLGKGEVAGPIPAMGTRFWADVYLKKLFYKDKRLWLRINLSEINPMSTLAQLATWIMVKLH